MALFPNIVKWTRPIREDASQFLFLGASKETAVLFAVKDGRTAFESSEAQH